MTWVLDETKSMLRDSAQSFLRERAPVSQLRALRDRADPVGHDPALWQAFAEQGYCATLVPEAHGGLALGVTEAGLIAEEMGHTLAAVMGSPANDATKMRLPLRYRRAYQYIMEHLNDENMSVRQVAAHVDVTERALQLAFRTHLGMTPAELIRTRRMERIRDDLCQDTSGRGVREVAARWGITNRSTLSNSYRLHFDETPTQTLQGGARTGNEEPAPWMAAQPQDGVRGSLSA